MFPGGIESLPRRQYELLASIEYRSVFRGATVPPQLIWEFCPDGGVLLSAGCGPGEKAIAQAQRGEDRGIQVIGVDINPNAIAVAQEASRDLPNASFLEDDVTRPGLAWRLASKRVTGIVAEGLFCNLIGEDSQLALDVFDDIVTAHGKLFVADCLHVDDSSARKLLDFEEDYSEQKLRKWVGKWRNRYGENERLGLEWLTFAVMPPGIEKEREFATAEELAALIEEGKIERFARHWDRYEFLRQSQLAGFVALRWEDYVWRSRTGEWILGMVAVFEKSD